MKSQSMLMRPVSNTRRTLYFPGLMLASPKWCSAYVSSPPVSRMCVDTLADCVTVCNCSRIIMPGVCCKHTHTHTHTGCKHAQTHARIHTHTHPYTYIHTCIQYSTYITQTCIHTYTGIHTCKIHTYTHTGIHTNSVQQIQTQKQKTKVRIPRSSSAL